MSTTTRDRLHHAIAAWAETRSGAHTAALNEAVNGVCTELDMLRLEVASQAESLGAAGETIAQLQAQARNAAAPAVLQALEDLTIAYRALAGLDGAWDQPLIRAERALVAAKSPPMHGAPVAYINRVAADWLMANPDGVTGAIVSARPLAESVAIRIEVEPAPIGPRAGPGSTAHDDQRRSVPSEGWIDTDRERSAQGSSAA